jgi:hypothetical protein
MLSSDTYALQPSLLDGERTLVIKPDYLEYESTLLVNQPPTRLNKQDIADFCHYYDDIRWYHFYVGKAYTIRFKAHDGRILDIYFKNYFGRRSAYHAIYADLIEKIWNYYFLDIVDGYLARYHQGEAITLGKVKISNNGVAVTGTGLSFTWEELALKEYVSYFSIYKPKQPEFHLWVKFNEWNSELLLSILKTLKSEWQKVTEPRNSP